MRPGRTRQCPLQRTCQPRPGVRSWPRKEFMLCMNAIHPARSTGSHGARSCGLTCPRIPVFQNVAPIDKHELLRPRRIRREEKPPDCSKVRMRGHKPTRLELEIHPQEKCPRNFGSSPVRHSSCQAGDCVQMLKFVHEVKSPAKKLPRASRTVFSWKQKPTAPKVFLIGPTPNQMAESCAQAAFLITLAWLRWAWTGVLGTFAADWQ